jgi:hypothetical protein
MARTVAEIKQEITGTFMANETVQQRYELDLNKTFEEQFSPVSIENIIFYVIAVIVWGVEKLHDYHRAEVDAELLTKMPHTVRWYRDKVLRFQFPNRSLIPDTDRYDNTGLTDEQVKALEVVKYCAVTDKLSELQIKVAKGEPGVREPLSNDEVQGLEYYLSEVRDAGVKTVIVNRQADKLYAVADIYYNPLQLEPASKPVEAAIKDYISNLAFNGALSYTRLVDMIQSVQGVELVDIKMLKVQRADNQREELGVQKIAESGYWIVQNDDDLEVTYKVYSNEDIT